MPSCPNCGRDTQPAYRFCGACGAELPRAETVTETPPPPTAGPEPETPSAPTAEPEPPPVPAARPEPEFRSATFAAARPEPGRDSPYYISPYRILVLTALSYGLYMFYWFYITWKHYRDHTGRAAYPVWHALAVMVPVYNLFRAHAHIRSYNELMEDAGLSPDVTPWFAVGTLLALWVLALVSLLVSGGIEETASMTLRQVVITLALNGISIAVMAFMQVRVQMGLNIYWGRVTAPTWERVVSRTGTGEVVLSIVGILLWANTLLLLISPTYRTAGSF